MSVPRWRRAFLARLPQNLHRNKANCDEGIGFKPFRFFGAH
jgi:hypothetical protein